LKKDVSDTIDICVSKGSDDQAYSLPFIKQFLGLVRSLAADMSNLEAKSHDELRAKLKKANMKVMELLSSKMEKYRNDINMAMMKRQYTLRKLLAEFVQPLLNLLTEESSKALEIELKFESLSIPPMDFESFEAEIRKKMDGLVQAKQEKVEKTRTKQVVKYGACNSRRVQNYDEVYTVEETVGFKFSPKDLKKKWLERIEEQIEVSRKTTELLVKQEIDGEIDRVRLEVTGRCDNFMRTIQAELEQKSEQECEHKRSTHELEEHLTQIEDFMSDIDRLRSAVESQAQDAALGGFEVVDNETPCPA